MSKLKMQFIKYIILSFDQNVNYIGTYIAVCILSRRSNELFCPQ